MPQDIHPKSNYMKPLVVILAFIPLFSIAQTEYVTQITYSELNSIDQRMQNFMRDKMGMVITKAPTFGKEDGMQTLTIRYNKQTLVGTSYDPHINFKYFLFDIGTNNAIIKSCQIYGDYGLVVDFYVRFWPTTINLDAVKKQRIAYSYYWQDKITLGLNPENNTGRLSIFNTTIKSIAEYKSKAKDQKKYLDSLNTSRIKINQNQTDSIAKINAANSFYRDSLIKVAQNYDIAFTVTNSYNPSTNWLESAISITKNRLNSGTMRNTSDIKWLIDSIQKNMSIDPHDYFFVDILFYIDRSGIITKVEQSNAEKNFSTKYLPQINKISVGKKLTPLTAKDGSTYPSLIKCFAQNTNIGLSIRKE